MWLVALAIALPAGCKGRGYVISGYGSKMSPTQKLGDRAGHRKGGHAAIDVRADVGDVVLASAPGVVVRVALDRKAGWFVQVAHEPHRRHTFYLHLQKPPVVPGQRVERGEPLGVVGMFPYSGKFPHVHLELCTRRCVRPHVEGDLEDTEDPLARMDGCFDRETRYPDDRLVLTLPIRC
jgi:murein DD-endopeptidase MepM/ murein hydrolase activator NlpD